MENVPQIEKHTPFNDFVALLKRLKYNVAWGVIDCAEFGVPQRRKRMVLLASLLGQISMPLPTRKNPNKWVTVKKPSAT